MSIGVEDLITLRLDLQGEFRRLIRQEVKKYNDPNNHFEFGKGSGLLMSNKFMELAFIKAVAMKNEREGIAKEREDG